MHRAVNLIVNCSGIIRKLFRVHLIQRSRRSFCIAGLEACIGVNQKFIIIAFCFRRLFLCLSVSLQGIQLTLQIIDLRLPGCQLIAVFPDLVRRLTAHRLYLCRDRKEPHESHAHHQADKDIQDHIDAGVFLIGSRHDDRLISAGIGNDIRILPILLFLFRLRGTSRRLSGQLRQLSLIMKRNIVRLIDGQSSLQFPFRPLVFLRLDVKEGQELMSLHQLGIQRQHLLQLDDCQILASLLAVQQRLIVFLNGLIDRVKPRRICLNRVDILVCDVFLRLQVLADDPFGQSRYHVAHLKTDQSQQVSGLYIVLIQLQTVPQILHGA